MYFLKEKEKVKKTLEEFVNIGIINQASMPGGDSSYERGGDARRKF